MRYDAYGQKILSWKEKLFTGTLVLAGCQYITAHVSAWMNEVGTLDISRFGELYDKGKSAFVAARCERSSVGG